MVKRRNLTNKDCILHPSCFHESRGIYILKNYNSLAKDCISLLSKLEDDDDNEIYEYDKKKLGRYMWNALCEATYLLSMLNSSSCFNSSKKNGVDYVALAKGKYIDNKENDLAYLANRSTTDSGKYATSTMARDLRTIGCIIEDLLDREPSLFKHLTLYMENISN